MARPISVAVLSYGMSGKVFHCPLLASNRGFSLNGIVKRDGESVLEYPKVKIYDSIDAVIADHSIELVIINLPNQYHFKTANEALKAGMHVVVEKPFTITTFEAKALITLAQKKRKLLTVFHNRRWDSDFLTIKKLLKEKSLGRIVEFEAHYDRWRNYVQSKTWKENSGPGSGILYNLGSHMIDQALNLFGYPKYVDARLGIHRTGGKVDDFYDIRLEYANHLVILKSSYLVKELGPRYSIHGDKGSFIKYGIDPQEKSLNEGKKPIGKKWGEESKQYWGKLTIEGKSKAIRYPSLRGNYQAFYDNLYQAIRFNKTLVVKPEEALKVIRLIETCIESNEQKAAIKFNP